MSRALYEQQKYREAISLYDKALQMSSGYTFCYLNKGIALGHLGCNEEAEQMHSKLEELLEISPASRSFMIERIENALRISSSNGSREGLPDQKEHLNKKLVLLREALDRLKNTSKEVVGSDEGELKQGNKI